MTMKEAMVAKPAIKLYNPIPQPVKAMQYKDAYRKEFLDKIPHTYWVMNSMRTLRIRVGTEWFGISEDEWLIMGENNDSLDIMSNTKFRRIYQIYSTGRVWIERRPRRVSASILAAAPTSFEAARLPNSAPPPLSYAP